MKSSFLAATNSSFNFNVDWNNATSGTSINKIDEKEPDEPDPGDGDPNFNIEKKLVAVVSKLERPIKDSQIPDTHDVQRGDKAIFEITVTNTKENPEDEDVDVDPPNEDEVTKKEIGRSRYNPNGKVFCHGTEWTYIPGLGMVQKQCSGFASSDSLTDDIAYETTTKRIDRTYYIKHIEYSIKKIQLKDEVEEKFLKDAVYYENADFTEYCIDGLNFKFFFALLISNLI